MKPHRCTMIKGDEILRGTYRELEEMTGVPIYTIRAACYMDRETKDGYRVYRDEEAPIIVKETVWTKDLEPYLDLAGAIAKIIITDYQNNPNTANKAALKSDYFHTITLGEVDPSSIITPGLRLRLRRRSNDS